jgi:8-oxo-dGTP pyrophosphatase MutT (NUDIX family)
MTISIDDLRMIAPQCTSLTPVVTIHENRWFALRNRGGYYTIEYHRPQVAVLPIVDNHSIVMVKVKRPVIDDIPLELPAGAAKVDEKPVTTAARELQEETGIRIAQSDRFQLLPSLVISSSRYPILPWIYQIDISKREFDLRDPHDEEIVSVECISFEEVQRRIICSEIYISLAVAVLSRFLFSKNELK